MRILIGCEFSGIVRDAFIAAGHDAVSCDIVDTDVPGPHIKADLLSVLTDGWDCLIAFPPCTHLCVSGARWWPEKKARGVQDAAIEFFMRCIEAPIAKVAVENPIGLMSTRYRKPDQIIQPWMFGHGETKATCLWLKNLPELLPTNIVDGRESRIHRLPPTSDRSKIRSTTYRGIAAAMASQWCKE